MAKKKTQTEKNYNVNVALGSLSVVMKGKGVDGGYHSMVFPYPCYERVDGKVKTLRRSELIKRALARMSKFYPDGTTNTK